MDVGFQLFQFFFLFYAETLLFIDDDKAEMSEFYFLGEDSVGADNDVDAAINHALAGEFGIPCGYHA